MQANLNRQDIKYTIQNIVPLTQCVNSVWRHTHSEERKFIQIQIQLIIESINIPKKIIYNTNSGIGDPSSDRIMYIHKIIPITRMLVLH